MIDIAALHTFLTDEILLDEVELEPSTDLLLSGLMDSLGVMALVEHLERHGVEAGRVSTRYGAEGFGPSMYIEDPEGNTVELEGPPDESS